MTCPTSLTRRTGWTVLTRLRAPTIPAASMPSDLKCSERSWRRRCCSLAFLLCWLILFTSACRHAMPDASPSSRPDINQVLERHQQELMALPNVVGVYVGLMPDQKTPCLKVMLSRKDRASQGRIPKSLEGYPVRTEVTGDIRPM